MSKRRLLINDSEPDNTSFRDALMELIINLINQLDCGPIHTDMIDSIVINIPQRTCDTFFHKFFGDLYKDESLGIQFLAGALPDTKKFHLASQKFIVSHINIYRNDGTLLSDDPSYGIKNCTVPNGFDWLYDQAQHEIERMAYKNDHRET